jgi:hypothetical protein
MRRQTTILILAVLVAFPALTWAQISSGDVSGTVTAYANQTATYQTGCVQMDTYEKATVDKVEVVITGEYTGLGGQSSVPCSPCGTDLGQGNLEVNTTITRTASEYTAMSKGTYLTGSANMTSLGGMSLCNTAGTSGEGSLSQSQTVNLNAGGTLAPGITGSASYTGTQCFTATITSQ